MRKIIFKKIIKLIILCQFLEMSQSTLNIFILMYTNTHTHTVFVTSMVFKRLTNVQYVLKKRWLTGR